MQKLSSRVRLWIRGSSRHGRRPTGLDWYCRSLGGRPKDLVIVEAEPSLVPDRIWLEDLSENLCHGSPVRAVGRSLFNGFLSATSLQLAPKRAPRHMVAKSRGQMEDLDRHSLTLRRIRTSFHLAITLAISGTISFGRLVGGAEPVVAPKPDSLSRRLEAVLATPGFRYGHWGILVVDRKSGQTIFERNADSLFAPASVTKLYSAAAALVEFGPNYRFKTPLLRRGEIDDKGKLNGDVILVAQGDMAMGAAPVPKER